MSPTIEIVSLSQSRRDLSRFLNVSKRVYRNDPLWVAPLASDLSRVLGPRNPLFQHARIQLWIAQARGRDVGRIAGIIDDHHQAPEPTAFFGFFESLPEPSISAALFNTVHDWARTQGATRMLGPMNPTTNDECGLLVSGFDRQPVFMMTYNPASYPELIAAQGYAKAKDLFAFRIDIARTPLDRIERLTRRFRERNPGLRVRTVTKQTLANDLPRLVKLYNAAWEQNWGFVRMTHAEIQFLAQRLKPLLVDGFVQATESGGEIVGFLLAVPDVNEIIKPLNGGFCSTGLLKSLPYLLGWKQPRTARVIALGVSREFRGRGIESAMLADAIRKGAALGYQEAEAGWVLEDNLKSSRVIEAVGGARNKTYRLYDRSLV